MTDWKDILGDTKEKYNLYLCSREWAEKREAVRERSGGKCERCGVNAMDACHHLTYERKYAELVEDLQATCTPCHEFTHGKRDSDPSSERRPVPPEPLAIKIEMFKNCRELDERNPGVLIRGTYSESDSGNVEIWFHGWVANGDVGAGLIWASMPKGRFQRWILKAAEEIARGDRPCAERI